MCKHRSLCLWEIFYKWWVLKLLGQHFPGHCGACSLGGETRAWFIKEVWTPPSSCSPLTVWVIDFAALCGWRPSFLQWAGVHVHQGTAEELQDVGDAGKVGGRASVVTQRPPTALPPPHSKFLRHLLGPFFLEPPVSGKEGAWQRLRASSQPLRA